MTTTELIPRIDEDGLMKANSDLANLKLQLAPIKQDIEQGEVKTEEDFAAMGKLVVQVKDNQKKREWIIAPFKSIMATIKDRINEMGNVDDCKTLEKLGKQKMADWRRPELEATSEEREDINKGRAKKGLPPIEVKPNIPKTPGMQLRTNYHAECEELERLLHAYRIGTPARRAFLQQFLMADNQAIGKFARDTKDDEAVMKQIPGVTAWHD